MLYKSEFVHIHYITAVTADISLRRPHWKTEPFVDQIEQRFATGAATEVFAKEIGHIVDSPAALAGDVGGNDDVGEIPEPTCGREGFFGGAIEHGAEQMAGFEGGNQIALNDKFATGHVRE